MFEFIALAIKCLRGIIVKISMFCRCKSKCQLGDRADE